MSKTQKLVDLLSKNITKLNVEDQKIFSDIMLKIRFSNISESDSEEFLQQLLDATLQAEKEGKSINHILGTDDIQAFCDSIILEYQSKYPLWKKFMFKLDLILGILLTFTGVFEFLLYIIQTSIQAKTLQLQVNITASTVINLFICTLTVFFFLSLIRNAFDMKKNGHPKSFDKKLFWLLFIAACLFALSTYFLNKYILFTFNALYFFIPVTLLYFVTKRLSL